MVFISLSVLLTVRYGFIKAMADTGRKRTVHDITCRGIPP